MRIKVQRRSSKNNLDAPTSSSLTVGGGGSSSLRGSTLQFRMAQMQEAGAFDGTTPTTNNSRCSRYCGSSGCCLGCRSDSPKISRVRRCLRSTVWKWLMIWFSFCLLFGSQIQHLWVAPEGDIFFDILSTITFAFFAVDIICRILVYPDYFRFHLCCARDGSSSSPLSCSPCVLGSFMFWCDLISTGVSLLDIGYINPHYYSVVEVNIQLNNQGVPVDGFDTFNRLRPVPLELVLLATIARCARAARFVQSRTVVHASKQVNWYWFVNFMQMFNPVFYWRRYQERRHQTRMATMAAAGEESAAFVASTKEDKRTAWGMLQVGILAAVRAQAELEAQQQKYNSRLKWPRRVWYSVKRALNPLGCLPFGTRARRRHQAAIKIQRAWKAHLQYVKVENESHDGFDNSTDLNAPFQSSTYQRSKRVRQIGQKVEKRATLRPFGRMNARAGGRLDPDMIQESLEEEKRESRFQSQAGKGLESQVGSDMRQLTGKRVAIGVLLAMVFTVVFTYTETNSTRSTTMVVLHEQTMFPQFQMEALYTARNTSTPDLYSYELSNGEVLAFPLVDEKYDPDDLRDREKLRVTVLDGSKNQSIGYFAYRQERQQEAVTEVVATLFIIIVWYFGVTAFAGPVMSLVVVPIERMVRLLGMLMLDPLGYQSTSRFKKFLIEEDTLIRNTMWTKEVLKGMETSFLMSTILRIGSLMKVGFGSAGVEIIRNNLQKGQSKNMLILSSQGSTVSCIFLFCDIRQFTDATECLQEEVFVFTNRIAAVVHSICHSYGGAANKNVGDAFLLSWSLEDNDNSRTSRTNLSRDTEVSLKAKNNQADKALLSVIKICISLYYDKYYLEPLSVTARERLKAKLKNRVGPYVQMGFGLHAGKAVQGAIGSQRKIDATYVSEAVNRAEFLESRTKEYGLKMLMSDSFHRLLHRNTRLRCRKIDQILIQDDEEDEDEDDDELQGERMDLYTFDMDVAAIHRPQPKAPKGDTDTISENGSLRGIELSRKRITRGHGSTRQMRRRKSMTLRGSSTNFETSAELLSGGPAGVSDNNTMGSPSVGNASTSSVHSADESAKFHLQGSPDLVLPTGPALYSHNVWQSPDMKRIRDKFVQGLFFQKFNTGLQAYYNKDWDTAKQCFQTVLENFDDGPSRYFMTQMERQNGVPPNDFLPYSLA